MAMLLGLQQPQRVHRVTQGNNQGLRLRTSIVRNFQRCEAVVSVPHQEGYKVALPREPVRRHSHLSASSSSYVASCSLKAIRRRSTPSKSSKSKSVRCPVATEAVLMEVGVGAAALCLAVVVRKSFVIVGQGDGSLIERLGVYSRTLGPGLHLMIPFIEYVSANETLREQVLDVPPQQCITADNAPITADAVVYYRIADLQSARYKVEMLVPALQNLVLTQLRNAIGKLTLDETFSARTSVNLQLMSDLDLATASWGVEVTRVEVRDILPAPSIRGSLEKQMAAERTKRADILESEGSRDAAINEAEGQAQAQIVRAKAEAQAAVVEAKARAEAVVLGAEAEKQKRVLVSQGLAAAVNDLAEQLGVSSSEAAQLYLARDYVEASKTIGEGASSKVLFMDPASVGGTVASLASIVNEKKEGAADDPSRHDHLVDTSGAAAPALPGSPLASIVRESQATNGHVGAE